MTREELSAQYELLKEVGAQGGSFHALSGSGAVVMVHFLGPPGGERASQVLANIGRLEPAESRRILEVIDVDGESVVVTKFITDFQSLEAWLGARVTPGGEVSPPAAPPMPPAVDPSEAPTVVLNKPPSADPPVQPTGPGEFTRMFDAPGASDSSDPWSRPPQARSPGLEEPNPRSVDPEPAPPPAVSPGPGEFTRMFQAGDPVEPSPPRPVSDTPGAPGGAAPPRPTSPADPPRPHLPDELPGAKPGWWGPLEGQAPEKPAEPGSFTRMFRTSGLPGEVDQPTPPQPTVPLGGSPPGGSPPNPLYQGADPYLERLKSAPEPDSAAPPVPVRPTRPPVPSGPGEFTRVIQGAGQGPAPPVSAPPPTQPPPPEKPQRAGVLVVAAVGIVAVGVLLVVLFALLGGDGASPAADVPVDPDSIQGP